MGNNQTPFRDWLSRKCNEHGWSVRYLASLTTYSHTHVGNVLRGEQPATWEFVEQIAKVFDEPVLRLFIMAGLLELPDDLELDQESSVIVDIYKQMPRKHQKEIYEYVRWYGERHKEDKNNN